jgi:hypothetical protein
MPVSLDGFIEGVNGEIDEAVVNEMLHRRFNDWESTSRCSSNIPQGNGDRPKTKEGDRNEQCTGTGRHA